VSSIIILLNYPATAPVMHLEPGLDEPRQEKVNEPAGNVTVTRFHASSVDGGTLTVSRS
jgi:hypothetical protein